MVVVKVVVSIAVLTLLSLAGLSEAAVINAPSCSQSDVATAVNKASEGDTVQVPAGTCSWTSTLRITKGITLAGAGIDQTIILDDVPRAGGGQVLIFDSSSPSQAWRLTGFTFRPGSIAEWNWNGLLVAAGRSHAFRIDHAKFDDPNSSAIRTYGDLWGVIDHCEFFTSKNGNAIIPWHDVWQGVGSYGDSSFATATNLGSQEAVYIEDNTFTVSGGLLMVVDGFAGGRFVARYNKFNNAAAGGHGTDSGGRIRGLRKFEIYNNTFTVPGLGFAAIYIRGGTGLAFNNTFSGGFSHGLLAAVYRYDGPSTPWGKCDGSSPFDGNSGTPAGYPCIDQPGRGAGSLLSGETPAAAWPRQEMEPIYTWGNTLNGSDIASQQAPVQLGRDLLLDTPKPGYVPFTYPHPLVGGAATPPPAATNQPAAPQLPAAPSNLKLQ